MECRNCRSVLKYQFIDLKTSPPSNSFLSKEDLNNGEMYYPLKVMVCDKCFLVQLDEYKKSKEIFSENYVYFSSFSSTWLAHCSNYVEMITKRLKLTPQSLVMEVASNDGCLLNNFVKAGIPCFGVEPTLSTAKVSQEKGIDTIVDFFSKKTAETILKSKGSVDLAIGNNVLAHVPDIHDFVAGFKHLLKPNGVITFEFPHLLQLLRNNQFDTIYHEHFSYLSLKAVENIFKLHNLKVFDVEELSTHGGSLRVYGAHQESIHLPSSRLDDLRKKEEQEGMYDINYYLNFSEKLKKVKFEAMNFLMQAKNNGLKVAAYGAAAKGNTFINFCGINEDLISLVVDASPHKQNKYLPGSRIPVVSMEALIRFNPDVIVILPWNIKEEITTQLRSTFKDIKLVTFIPKLEVIQI